MRLLSYYSGFDVARDAGLGAFFRAQLVFVSGFSAVVMFDGFWGIVHGYFSGFLPFLFGLGFPRLYAIVGSSMRW